MNQPYGKSPRHQTRKAIVLVYAYGGSMKMLKRKYGARAVNVAVKHITPPDFRGRIYPVCEECGYEQSYLIDDDGIEMCQNCYDGAW